MGRDKDAPDNQSLYADFRIADRSGFQFTMIKMVHEKTGAKVSLHTILFFRLLAVLVF
jgi:hypothetical protein